MFIISNFLNNRRDKMTAWQTARNKFINSDECKYSYDRDDWDEKHPKPFKQWDDIKWPVIYISMFTFATLAIIGIVVTSSSPDNSSKEKVASVQKSEDSKKEEPKDENKCQEFKKGSFVIIQYGDMKGVTGTIVGGCGHNDAYQVKLTDGAKVEIPHDGKEGEVAVGGWVIPVGNDNIVEIDKPKDK